MQDGPPKKFVSEALRPLETAAGTTAMAKGEPGLPAAFAWRGETLRVARVRRTWREKGPCTHGSGEMYLRKHWFEVETDTGRIAEIYFERRPRGRDRTRRWWLFRIEAAKPPTGKRTA